MRKDPRIAGLEERLGYTFRDPLLLDLALSHRSHAHEAGRGAHPSALHNEKLEFLGDAILGFVVGQRLYEAAGLRETVGTLSRRRARLVSAAPLAARARALGIGQALKLGKGERSSGGGDKDSLLADAFEAVVAAIFLDGGIEAARTFILRLFDRELVEDAGAISDPKSQLQEIVQSRGLPVPEYRVIAESGASNEKLFEVEVILGGERLGAGEGRTKKAASVAAARAALRKL